MRKQTAWITALAAAAMMTLASCSGSQPLSTREEGTLGGAGLGAAGGALVGAAVGHPAAGALIGGGLGGVGGYAVGNEMQNNENANAQTQQQLQSASIVLHHFQVGWPLPWRPSAVAASPPRVRAEPYVGYVAES